MWFGFKRDVAPLYKDETMRRAFATASGRPKGVDKLKKMKLADSKADPEDEQPRSWRERLFGRAN
ncbi:MAG TPA: hypothetical protein VLC48_09425 [Gemmatimonadota bacterium]|nr:hypothetical protein [Gemmatimonadota bacterium]